MSKETEQGHVSEQAEVALSNSGTPSPLVAALQHANPEWVGEVTEAFGEVTAIVPREKIAELCSYLKTAPEFEFNFLSDICGADRGPEEEPRFEVNYHLFSTVKHHRLRLKVVLNDDDTHVPTVTGVWRTANWHERETLICLDHFDATRICVAFFARRLEGHALAKIFRCAVMNRTA